MANLFTYINTLLKPYYKYILGFVLFVLFVSIARFAYQRYFARMNKNKKFLDVANTSNVKPIMGLYFFHVDWCPHCVKAQPEWKNFSDQFHNKEINGYLLQCYDVDCTEDNGDEVIQIVPNSPPITNRFSKPKSDGTYSETHIEPTPIKIIELVKKYNIDSYPTVKLTKDDMVVEFEAKITKDSLIKFVNSV
jgi:thiol-disulfide isomerase/thioredoxin